MMSPPSSCLQAASRDGVRRGAEVSLLLSAQQEAALESLSRVKA